MHFGAWRLVLVFIASVCAQINGAPKCAQAPLSEAIGASSCPGTDIACLCRSERVITNARDNVVRACSPADKVAALQFLGSLCASVNVDITYGIEGAIISLQTDSATSPAARSTSAAASFSPAAGAPTLLLTTVSGTPAFLTAATSPTGAAALAGADGGANLSQGAKIGLGVGVGVGVPGAAAAVAGLVLLRRRRYRERRARDHLGVAHEREPNSGVEGDDSVSLTKLGTRWESGR